MLIFAPEREYKTTPVKCVIEIQGRTYDAVLTEYCRYLSDFDEKMNMTKK